MNSSAQAPLACGSEPVLLPDNLHPNEPTTFYTLDAMRGIAALCVMIYHFSDYLFGPTVLSSSYLAVDFFFLLSGFVIAHAYGERLRRGMTLRQFALVRLIRLYPLYLLGSAIGLFYIITRGELDTGRAVSLVDLARSVSLSLLMLPQLGASPLSGLFPFDLAAWSLFFEVAVNLSFAAVPRLWSTRALIIGVLLSAVGLVVAAMQRGSLDVGMVNTSFAGGAFRCIFGFLLGVLLYRLRDRSRLQAAPEAGMLALLLIFACAPSTSRLVYDLLAAFLLFPTVLMCSRHTNVGRKRRLYELLALLSFPLYILHTPLLFLETGIFKVVVRRDPMSLRPVSGLVLIVSTIAISYLIAALIDAPLRKWLRRALKPWISGPGRRSLASQGAH